MCSLGISSISMTPSCWHSSTSRRQAITSSQNQTHHSTERNSMALPRPQEHNTSRRISTSWMKSGLVLISLTILSSSCCVTTTHATSTGPNPVQVGFRSAAAHSPLLSRWIATRRNNVAKSSTTSTRQSHPTVMPVQRVVQDEDDYLDDNDDKAVQSAFWHAKTPTDVYQSRHIEFPVSRQSSTSRASADEPESELDFLESQILGGNNNHNLLAKNVAALTPTRSRTIPPAGRSSSTSTLLDNNTEQEERQSNEVHEPGTSGSSASISSLGGAATTASTVEDVRGGVVASRPLVFWETMVCGAISRSVAQTIMHPANTMKTILQSQRGSSVVDLLKPSSFHRLTYGAGANFLLSVPTGALNFAVLEFVRQRMGQVVQSTPFLASRQEKLGAGLDFMSSAISTIACSVVATPQMMITDNIMVGNYPNLFKATKGLYTKQGVVAFYRGWWPGLVGKIPSYALTWTLFQQLKQARNRISKRPAKHYENSIMGCLASGTTVCIMIPMDTIKTRLVTQTGGIAAGAIPYKGIIDCAVRIAKEEGIGAFYRGLPPRLVSVVPMIGIQFGVYEAMKKVMLRRQVAPVTTPKPQRGQKKLAAAAAAEAAKEQEEVFEGVAMEVGASHGTPLTVPHMHDHEHFEDLAAKSKKSDKHVQQQKPRTKTRN